MIRQKDAEIANSTKILKQKDESIKSYQERLLTIPILEHKLAGLRESHEKEKEQVKRYYKQEFSNLTREVQHIHQALTVNLSLDEKIKVLEKQLNSYKDFNVSKIHALEDKINRFDAANEKFDNSVENHQIYIQPEEGELPIRKTSIGSTIIHTKESIKTFKTRPATATK